MPNHSNPNTDPDFSANSETDHPVTDNREKDTPSKLFGVYLKGMAMGAADIVPGVSGGTIALIAGIYERLIGALSRIGIALIPLWRQHGLVNGFVAVWRHVDATFLLCLLLGIATSFITLAGVIQYLLSNQPLMIWSFFFGLVVATVFILLSEVERWTVVRFALFIFGMLAAIGISLAPILAATPSLPFLFFAGAIAICAMILPGVSGSFILLLLGVYDTVLSAVHSFNLPIIATVAAGTLSGLLAFTRVLKWLLSHYYQATLALLTGFIAGSLMKIWPWKDAAVTSMGGNVLPWHYPTGAHWEVTLPLMLIGAVLVSVLSWWGLKKDDRQETQ